MNNRKNLMAIVSGALGSIGEFISPTQNYNQRKVKVLGYKTGGKPFTKGKRSKSLKTRSNRRKAKSRCSIKS